MKKILLILTLFIFLTACEKDSNQSQNTGPQSAEAKLAACLTEKGIKVYGTSWCSHCQNQKAMFGDEALNFLSFTDCDENKELCQEAGIEGYPTWVMADGSHKPGEQQLSTLAKLSGCAY